MDEQAVQLKLCASNVLLSTAAQANNFDIVCRASETVQLELELSREELVLLLSATALSIDIKYGGQELIIVSTFPSTIYLQFRDQELLLIVGTTSSAFDIELGGQGIYFVFLDQTGNIIPRIQLQPWLSAQELGSCIFLVGVGMGIVLIIYREAFYVVACI